MESNKELEKAIEDKFLTPQKFSMEIETIVAKEKVNYIEAICQYCDDNDIAIVSGESAQIDQAISLGIVSTLS